MARVTQSILSLDYHPLMDIPVAEIQSNNGQTTVILREDLDLYAVPVVKPIILEAVRENPEGGFVVDLSCVTFVDSAGLAFLLTLRKNPSLEGPLVGSRGNQESPRAGLAAYTPRLLH